MNMQQVKKNNYNFKGWLLIDLSSIIPVSYFMSDEGSTSGKGYNKLLKLLRLPRLYR